MKTINKIIREEISLNDLINKTTDLIAEGLNNPIPVNLNKVGSNYEGEFNIDSNSYKIIIEETSPNCYIFKFTKDDSYELVDDVKKAFQVIPTIRKVAENFIMENKPNMFSFFITDGSRGRDKMYPSFTNDISKKYNYEKNIKKYDDKIKSYILFNNKTTDEDFSSLIRNIDRYRN